MLLGKDKDIEPRGPLAGLKKKWATLEPKTQKTITLVIVGIAIVVFAGLGYHSRHKRSHKTTKTHEPETKEISLDTDMIEKSLFRQAQETINQQGKLIADLRKEIAKIKAAQLQQESRATESGRKIIPPPPSGKKKTKPGAPKPAAVPTQYYAPPPPPPSIGPGGKKGEETSVIGGITFISNPLPAPKAKKEGKKKLQIYLPPSFMEATLLSGLDAPTTTSGKNNPVPVLLRIKDLAVLPNRVKANLKGCFVLGEGRGNLASERVDVRLLTLSCVSRNGEAVIDQAVKGYVVDEDGKAGLRGLVSAKMGAILARSALAGFLGGLGEAVRSSAMSYQTTALGTQTQVFSNTDASHIARAAVGGGISEASKNLQKFYLQLAQQTLPIIQVGATKTVTVVISEGVKLEVKDAEIFK